MLRLNSFCLVLLGIFIIIIELIMTAPTLAFTLKRDRDYTRELFITQKGNALIFKLDPCLFSENVRVFFNFPDEKCHFERLMFFEIFWENASSDGRSLSFYDRCTKPIKLNRAGTYEFYFTIDGSQKRENFNGRGYIVVQPHLATEGDKQPLPMTGICMQSYLAKLLGPLPNWEKTLRVSKESGYNFIHLTPLQEIGKSNSAYCLMSRDKINPAFKCNWADLGNFFSKLKQEHNIFTITDLVLNHTANETDWLLTNPETAYNLDNSPHLRSAYLLDRLFYWFNVQVSEGRWAPMGIPPDVNEVSQLEIIRTVLSDLVKGVAIHELYLADVDKCASAFKHQLGDAIRSAKLVVTVPGNGSGGSNGNNRLELIPHPRYHRFGATVDFAKACQHLGVEFSRASWTDQQLQLDYIDYMTNRYRQMLHQLNENKKAEINDHVSHAVRNYIENIRYRFVDGHGLKLGRVTLLTPLAYQYFIKIGPKQGNNLTEDEQLAFDPVQSKFIMAHNGWVMCDDPLRNFAEPGSWIYQRRELIPWGDSVKLRFGRKYDDCPFLWDHFRRNAEETAKIFHGVRLDNCHSTPLPIAEYVLDAARRVRPDLLVVAELFTSDEAIDNYFVNRLGISLMIREAMTASNTHELGRLVHRFGGDPVGAFFQPSERPFRTSLAPAIFADQTHDNESPLKRHSAANMLPVSAMTCVAYCAASSNRGYDEFVPHHINVVSETRPYMPWTDCTDDLRVSAKTGLLPAKKALNRLHIWLSKNGFSETFVDQKSNEVITVTRHNPVTRESCVLIARTAFSPPNDAESVKPDLYKTPGLPNVEFQGVVKSIVLEGRTCHVPFVTSPPPFTMNMHVINNLLKYRVEIAENLAPKDSRFLTIKHSPDGMCDVSLDNFPAGSIAILRTSQVERTVSTIEELATKKELVAKADDELQAILKEISLADFNFVLYRCSEEDNAELGHGVYDVPGFGPFVYGGLQGLMSVLPTIRSSNDLGHPICTNLRNGDWLMDYIWARLARRRSLSKLSEFLQRRFGLVKQVPRFLVPAYFEMVISHVYNRIIEEILSRFDVKIREGPSIIRLLSLATLQFCGSNPFDKVFTVAAGLPHFSVGYMRSWGRDTFIALPGCLLATGRYDEARYIILKFAAKLKNGLIPNLLGDEGVPPRYNARDAVWFWLYSIRRYCEATKSHSILNELVEMDGRNGNTPRESRRLHELMHEALESHALGMQFRERNAGTSIDALMTSNGFNIEIGVKWDTGFVFGGNSDNCGTWMDKMGNSDRASNRGVPSTPRDGSAVELVGLSFAVVSWLGKLELAAYPHASVRRSTPLLPIKLSEWADLIQQNFDRWFYVPEADFVSPYIEEQYINQRCIYKDTVGASHEWSDYQLRPNFAVALAVAPELPLDAENAWAALDAFEKLLLGPLGVKTLDPTDYQYSPYYDPSENSSKYQTAGGFSYHQGPEWLWPFGFYACARFGIARRLSKEGTLESVKKSVDPRLGKCLGTIMASPWRSLPELTNAEGKDCPASCPAQAWSIASFLEGILALSDAVKSK